MLPATTAEQEATFARARQALIERMETDCDLHQLRQAWYWQALRCLHHHFPMYFPSPTSMLLAHRHGRAIPLAKADLASRLYPAVTMYLH